MLETTLNGLRLQLHASGAACLPELAMLLVADAHFGKAQSFRRLGVPVPQGTTAANLEQIDRLLALTGATQLVFLGDFLHSARSQTAALQAAWLAWRRRHAGLQLTLVRGNHDDRAGDPLPELGFSVVDEPLYVEHGAVRLALCHYPDPVAGAYVLAGHWHPCISLAGRAHERLRLPCFWLGDPAGHAVGVLPAFGDFTGMHPIERRPGDRVFAIADTVIREI